MKLENWALITKTPYSPPEMGMYFNGCVYDHPRFPDGYFIQTSSIVAFKDGKFKTYSGSIYELGNINPDYEKQFPDALNRILESAKSLPEFD